MRCRTTNAAWPSLRCQTAGVVRRARAARARRRGRGRSPAAGASRGRRRTAAPTARDPTARSLRDRCRAVAAARGRAARATPATSTVRLPSGTATTHGWPSGVVRALDRRVGPVELLVDFLLPAFRRDALAEVALRIHEADADERHAEVAGFLAVIAGEHAEAAGVDRQRLVQRELRGEVRDRPPVHVVEAAAATRCRARRARASSAPRSRRRRARETRDRRPRVLEHVRRHAPQHHHRVVRGLPPQRVVEPAEHLAAGVPASTTDRAPARASGDRSVGDRVGSSHGFTCTEQPSDLGFTAGADELTRTATDRCCRRRRRRRSSRGRRRPSRGDAPRRRRTPPRLRRSRGTRSATSFIARAASSSDDDDRVRDAPLRAAATSTAARTGRRRRRRTTAVQSSKSSARPAASDAASGAAVSGSARVDARARASAREARTRCRRAGRRRRSARSRRRRPAGLRESRAPTCRCR